MSHRRIRKNLLLYIDGSLGEKDTIEVKEHLPQCPHCSQQITVLLKIWKHGTAIEHFRPSPFLWTKLEARIAQSEAIHRPIDIVIEKYFPALRFSIAIVLLIISIFLGTYLGNIPQGSAQQNFEVTSNEYFSRTYHLDSFELSSDESVGQVIVLTSDERK